LDNYEDKEYEHESVHSNHCIDETSEEARTKFLIVLNNFEREEQREKDHKLLKKQL